MARENGEKPQPPSEVDDFEAWAARRKARKGMIQERKRGRRNKKRGKWKEAA